MFQTGELDAYLCKQELERLQRLEEEALAAEAVTAELEKPRRESASQIDDFFETPNPRAHHSMSYVSPRTMHGVPSEDDVFLKPPLWEDITSSIQKLDPENAEMLGSLTSATSLNNTTQIKMEVPDDMQLPSPEHLLHPLSIKTEKVAPPSPAPSLQMLGAPGPASPYHSASPQFHQTGYKMSYHVPRVFYAPPPTPPASEPGSPGSNLPRRTPPPPYPVPSAVPQSAKYNRRNNPELEKRRVHHCDFLGEYKLDV